MAISGLEERWGCPGAWLCFNAWPSAHIHSWEKPSSEGKWSKNPWMHLYFGQGS